MFARAAIVGRVARERAEARRNFLDHKAAMKKQMPQLTYRQRCFIPMLRGPCWTVGCGLFLIICGAIMCNFAFHAKELAAIKVIPSDNTTQSDSTTNKTTYVALKSLTFIGPSLMGLGIFFIIIACVVLCDKRDKVIKEFTDSMMRNQQDLSMELSFRAAAQSHNSVKQNNNESLHYDSVKPKSSKHSSHRDSHISTSSSLKSFRIIMQNISELGRDSMELEEDNSRSNSRSVSRSGTAESLLPDERITSDSVSRSGTVESLLPDERISSDSETRDNQTGLYNIKSASSHPSLILSDETAQTSTIAPLIKAPEYTIYIGQQHMQEEITGDKQLGINKSLVTPVTDINITDSDVVAHRTQTVSKQQT